MIYKRILKSSLTDCFYNWGVIATFLILYNLSLNYLVIPFGIRIVNLCAKYIGYSHLTIKNFPLNPIFLIVVLFVALLYGVYGFFEINTVIVYLNECHFKKKIGLFDLIKEGFIKSIKVFRIKNWAAAFYIIVIVTLTDYGLNNDFITSIKFPNFLKEYIQEVFWLQLTYFVLIVLLVVILFFTVFIPIYFCLENKSFWNSFKNSFKFVIKNFYSLLKNEFKFLIINGSIIGLIYLVIQFIIYYFSLYLTQLVESSRTLNYPLSFLLGFQSVIYTTLPIATQLILTVYVFAFLYNLFISKEELNSNTAKTFKFSVNPLNSKWFTITIIFILFIGTTITRSFLAYNSIKRSTYLLGINGPEITAHRGASNISPENSASAIKNAIRERADWVEIDVTQSADGELIVSHSNNLKRIVGERILITESTLDELLQLDTGSYFNQTFEGERLITLEEAIDLCKGKIKMNIELKTHSSDSNLVERTIELVKSNNMVDDCVIASLDLPTLLQIESINPDIKTCFNTSIAFSGVELLPIDVFSIEQSYLTEEMIDRIHAVNKEVFVWTVDTKEELVLLTKEYVDNVITNDVLLAQKVIKDAVEELSPENEDIISSYLMDLLFTI